MLIIRKVLVHWLNKRTKINYSLIGKNVIFTANNIHIPTSNANTEWQQQEIEKRLYSVIFFEFFYLTIKMNRTLLSEAVFWRRSVKKVFLNISQNSQKKTCAKFYLLKKGLWRRFFLMNFRNI